MNAVSIAKSIGAVVAGLVANVALSTAVDMGVVAAGIAPPFGDWTDAHYAMATGYRVVITVASCWLAARLAPSRPMTHALVLGGIGLTVAAAGAWIMRAEGHTWYPLSLVVTALPCAWLGGLLARRRAQPAAA